MELVQGIEKIQNLFNKGVISKDEYDSIKNRLLSSAYIESNNNLFKKESERILSLYENKLIEDSEMILLLKDITTQDIESTDTQPMIVAETNSDGKAWHYIDDKKQEQGPCNSEKMLELLNDKSINLNTRVWKTGLDEWTPLSKTELFQLRDTPPPVVNNVAAWVIAVSPLALAFMPWIAAIIVLSILFFWDYSILKKSNYNAELEVWWFFLVPVYLYKRAKILSQDNSIMITWVITFFIGLFLPALF